MASTAVRHTGSLGDACLGDWWTSRLGKTDIPLVLDKNILTGLTELSANINPWQTHYTKNRREIPSWRRLIRASSEEQIYAESNKNVMKRKGWMIQIEESLALSHGTVAPVSVGGKHATKIPFKQRKSSTNVSAGARTSVMHVCRYGHALFVPTVICSVMLHYTSLPWCKGMFKKLLGTMLSPLINHVIHPSLR